MRSIGQIRALEVTHGRLRRVNNGWHPHYHVLLFAAAGLDLAAFQDRLAMRWMLESVGFEVDEMFGLSAGPPGEFATVNGYFRARLGEPSSAATRL